MLLLSIPYNNGEIRSKNYSDLLGSVSEKKSTNEERLRENLFIYCYHFTLVLCFIDFIQCIYLH